MDRVRQRRSDITWPDPIHLKCHVITVGHLILTILSLFKERVKMISTWKDSSFGWLNKAFFSLISFEERRREKSSLVERKFLFYPFSLISWLCVQLSEKEEGRGDPFQSFLLQLVQVVRRHSSGTFFFSKKTHIDGCIWHFCAHFCLRGPGKQRFLCHFNLSLSLASFLNSSRDSFENVKSCGKKARAERKVELSLSLYTWNKVEHGGTKRLVGTSLVSISISFLCAPLDFNSLPITLYLVEHHVPWNKNLFFSVQA